MSQHPGKLIVLDGTDGSGKATQLEILKKRLEEEGFEVVTADFPQYNNKSAGPVEEYLSGKYGDAETVTPYQASIFYAVDRYDARSQLREWLAEGKIILANRYVSANMGHQGGKIKNALERKAFFNWLYDLEYNLFGLPRPDIALILHVEADISQRLAKKRARTDWSGGSKDIHEKSLKHLQEAEQTYLEIAASFPEFRLISCTKDGKIMTREEISLLVWATIRPLLSQLNKKTSQFSAIGDIIGSQGNNPLNPTPTSEISKLTQEEGGVTEPETKTNASIYSREKGGCLRVERLNSNAKLPSKAHADDAGYDLYADDCFSLEPYGQALISTGIRVAIPQGYVGLVWDKSGVAKDGLKTMGGVIDAGYRGEVKVIVKNLGEDVYNIAPGQKIAQLLIQPISLLPLSEEAIDDETARQDGGFGSSGRF